MQKCELVTKIKEYPRGGLCSILIIQVQEELFAKEAVLPDLHKCIKGSFWNCWIRYSKIKIVGNEQTNAPVLETIFFVKLRPLKLNLIWKDSFYFYFQHELNIALKIFIRNQFTRDHANKRNFWLMSSSSVFITLYSPFPSFRKAPENPWGIDKS